MRALPGLSITAILFLSIVTTAFFRDSESRSTHEQPFKSSLIDLPSLRLRVLLKNEEMRLHGQPVFDVYAKPIVSTDRSSLRYDGFATFLQDDLEFTYMVVEGVAYVVKSSIGDNGAYSSQTTRCLTSITPFSSIIDALNNLTAPYSGIVNDDEGECSSATLYETSFDGQNFFVCGFEGEGFIAFGEDLKVTVEYLDTPLRKISIPSNNNTSCAVVMPAATVMPTTLALLSGGTVST